MTKQQLKVRMRRVLRARRTRVRLYSYGRKIYLAVITKLENQTVKKHYEPYLRESDSSPPEPLKHLIALGNITNLAPPKSPTTLLSGIKTAGTPVGTLYGLS